jgi:Ca2+-binding RTX toxin-like protein
MSGTTVGGNDTLEGGEGFDVLIGDARFMFDATVGGNDTLEGGRGDDDLYGDGIRSDSAIGGADEFVFAPDSGRDTIFDFEQGKDLIDVRDYGAQSLADLTIVSSGGHSFIDLNGVAADNAGNEVTVLNIQTLVASDFLFA